MTSQEIAEAVVEWVREQLPALVDAYAYPPGNTGSLPDAAAVVQRIRTVRSEPERFPFPLLEQVDGLTVYDIELSVMVEQGEGEDAEREAHQQLEAFAETLKGSIVSDATLGSRVQMISPFAEFDLAEPFEERPNGTRGRALFGSLAVAEILVIDQ